MYVCLCNALNERKVREAIPGCATVAEVYRALGTTPACGKCAPVIADLLKSERKS